MRKCKDPADIRWVFEVLLWDMKRCNIYSVDSHSWMKGVDNIMKRKILLTIMALCLVFSTIFVDLAPFLPIL